MIKQKEIISFDEIKFDKDSLLYDMDKEGNRIADFYLPLYFDPEEKLDIKCGEDQPNIYIRVTEEKLKKKTKLFLEMYLTIWNAPDRPVYDWDRIWLLPGQIRIFIDAINEYLKDTCHFSYFDLFKNFSV